MNAHPATAAFALAIRTLVSLVFLTAACGKLRHWVLDDEGVIAAKGLVNNREHFESLIIAKETGFASVQSYLKAQPEPVK